MKNITEKYVEYMQRLVIKGSDVATEEIKELKELLVEVNDQAELDREEKFHDFLIRRTGQGILSTLEWIKQVEGSSDKDADTEKLLLTLKNYVQDISRWVVTNMDTNTTERRVSR